MKKVKFCACCGQIITNKRLHAQYCENCYRHRKQTIQKYYSRVQYYRNLHE